MLLLSEDSPTTFLPSLLWSLVQRRFTPATVLFLPLSLCALIIPCIPLFSAYSSSMPVIPVTFYKSTYSWRTGTPTLATPSPSSSLSPLSPYYQSLGMLWTLFTSASMASLPWSILSLTTCLFLYLLSQWTHLLLYHTTTVYKALSILLQTTPHHTTMPSHHGSSILTYIYIYIYWVALYNITISLWHIH